MSLLARVDHQIRVLYDKVHERGSHETVASRFWMALFQEFYRPFPGIFIAAEQAPRPGGRRRIDAVLYKVVRDDVAPKVYVEFKRHNRPQWLEERDREQVTDYCRALLAEDRSRRDILAMLCYGTRAQTWLVRRQGPSPRISGFTDADEGVGQHLQDFLNSVRYLLLNIATDIKMVFVST